MAGLNEGQEPALVVFGEPRQVGQHHQVEALQRLPCEALRAHAHRLERTRGAVARRERVLKEEEFVCVGHAPCVAIDEQHAERPARLKGEVAAVVGRHADLLADLRADVVKFVALHLELEDRGRPPAGGQQDLGDAERRCAVEEPDLPLCGAGVAAAAKLGLETVAARSTVVGGLHGQ